MISMVHSSHQGFAADHRAAETVRESDAEFRQRMRVNLFAAIALIALTAFGIWLANTMVTTEKVHGCYTSGEHTCSLI